jgi:hypothetical protein
MCIIEKIDEKSSNMIGNRVVVGDESVLGFKADNGQHIDELHETKRDFKFDDSDLVS